MGKLVYGMSTSLDGYVNDPDGEFGWSEPDEQTHRFVNEVQSGMGIYLLGRRLFETMKVWEDDAALADFPQYVRDYATIWRNARKIVYSTSLDDPGLPATSVERRLDFDAIRALKESTETDLTVGGPTLAEHLLRAGLVDELTLLIVPVAIGGGTRFLPRQLSLNLSLIEEQRFDSGTVFVRYAVQP